MEVLGEALAPGETMRTTNTTLTEEPAGVSDIREWEPEYLNLWAHNEWVN